MAKSFLTPAGGSVAGSAGNVVPFDANEWIPTDLDGAVMQALQKASVIERIARRSDMETDAEFKPRDHGTGIDSPRLVGFFPDTTGGDEVLLRPSVFGTQIAFERWDLDDTRPNPIPPKVQAWIRAAARATDRMALSTNPMTTRTAATNSATAGGTWVAIESGSSSTAVKPETHVPACSVFATLAIGRSEDKVLSPYSSSETPPTHAGSSLGERLFTPTDWKRAAGVSAVAEEYQFTPGMTAGDTRPIETSRPVHCCTVNQFLNAKTNSKGSAGYDLLSATKGILEDGYFYAEGEMVWIVPYSFKDVLRRVKDDNGLPMLATAPGGEGDTMLGDPVLYTPGGKLSRPATVIETPKANVVYAAASTPGTAAPSPADNAASHAFNPTTNGGFLSPTVYGTGASVTNQGAAKTVGVMLLYCHPMHLILGHRSGPEYMASRFNAESKFNKDFLKMQMRRGFSVGFPQAMSALVLVPGAQTAGKGVTAGDPVNPITGRAFTQNTA